jgi:hypothetical protein
MTLVENAIAQRKSDLREAKKGRGDAFDEIQGVPASNLISDSWRIDEVDEICRNGVRGTVP